MSTVVQNVLKHLL